MKDHNSVMCCHLSSRSHARYGVFNDLMVIMMILCMWNELRIEPLWFSDLHDCVTI